MVERRVSADAGSQAGSTRVASVRQLFFLLFAFLAASSLATAQATPATASCRADSNARALDFWIGEWTVREKGKAAIDGTDRVERILDGCAILEHWTGIGAGDVGESLFYFVPTTHRWKQVWTTPHATSLGGLKEKEMIALYPDHGIRFQGNLSTPSGAVVIDRTTLTPMADGTVHQVIEVSRDGGATWTVSYDAIYTRKG
jgi:hypothetical protein